MRAPPFFMSTMGKAEMNATITEPLPLETVPAVHFAGAVPVSELCQVLEEPIHVDSRGRQFGRKQNRNAPEAEVVILGDIEPCGSVCSLPAAPVQAGKI